MPVDHPVIFVCDIQTAFRKTIHCYSAVIHTAHKLLRASEILNIPVYVTTQNKSRLGGIVEELNIENVRTVRGDWDKTLFSMMVPELRAEIERMVEDVGKDGGKVTVAIVGIESHVCVLQTALDLLEMGVQVYLIADGVSSSHEGEVRIARERLSKAGAIVGTSEGFIYEVMKDAKCPEFRDMVKLVKETKEGSTKALDTLCKL